MAIIFAENPNGTAQADKVTRESCDAFCLYDLSDENFCTAAWDALCPAYNNFHPNTTQ